MADGKRKLVIEILSDAKGVNQGFDETESGLGRITKKLGTVALAFGAVAVAAVGAFAKSAVDAASSMAESLGKTRVVFGDSSAEVEAWGKTSAKAFGLSSQEALEAAGTYGNLFQAFGLGRQEATKMSKSLVGVAADLASFNNTSVDEALIALRSGLSGETEPLKRFGVAINDARLKQEALKLGLIKSTKDALTPAAKAQAAYALILHDTALAQGDFARTSGGLANQQRILEAQTNDLRVAIGEKLLPAKLAVVKLLNEKGIPAFQAFGEKLTDAYSAVKTLAESTIVQWVGALADGFGAARDAFSNARDAFSEFNKTGDWEAHGTFEKLGVVAARVVGGVTEGFAEITGGVRAMGAAFVAGDGDITSSGLAGHLEEAGLKARTLYDYLVKNKDTIVPITAGLAGFAVALVAINKASAGISIVSSTFKALGPALGTALAPLMANPVGLIIAGLVALGVAAYMLYTKFEPFRKVIDKIGRTIRDVALVAWADLQHALGVMSAFITGTVIPAVTSIWATIVTALTPLAKWIDENVISTFVAFGEAVAAAVERIVDAWKLLWQFIEPALRLLVTVVEDTFILVAKLIQGFVDTALPILAAAWAVVSVPVTIAFAAVKAVVETVLGEIRGVFQIFTGILSGDFGKIWEGFQTLVETPFNAIKSFIGTTFNTIWDLIAGMPGRIAGIAEGMWDGIKDAFKDAINWIIRAWNAIEFKIPGFDIGPFSWGGFTLGLPDIPTLAAGGIVTRPTLAMIGEGGPEAVVPLSGPNAGMGGLTVHAPIVINAGLGSDPVAISNAVKIAIRQIIRRDGTSFLAA